MKNSKYSAIISKLANGSPLNASISNSLWCQLAPTIRKNLNQTLRLSVRDGASGMKKFYWLLAPFGGGKSQAITQLVDSLSSVQGHYKLLASHIDLKEYSAKFNTMSFDLFVFKNLFNVEKPTDEIKSYIEKVSDESLKNEKFHNNIASLGIDVFSLLTQIPLPGVGTLLTELISRYRINRKTSNSRLKTVLADYNIHDANAINFLSKWLRYSLIPTKKNRQEFDEIITDLSDKNLLLQSLFKIIKTLKYSGIILLMDEADALYNATLTRYLETVWDNAKDNEFDLIILFAGNIDLTKFDSPKYGGFYRRMADSEMPSVKVENLKQPILAEYEEHIKHAILFLNNLDLSALGLDFTVPENLAEPIFNRMSSHPQLTWNKFWGLFFTVLAENKITVPNMI